MILAISTAATNTPVKPKTPAIKAMMRNVSTQLNMAALLLINHRHDARLEVYRSRPIIPYLVNTYIRRNP